MVSGDVLPSAVVTEILRLDVSHIFVLGGTGAISPTVVAALGGLIGL
jgi:putative cell wall-binding protein